VLILICCDTSGNHKLEGAFIGKLKKIMPSKIQL